MRPDELSKLFPGTRWEIRKTSSGTEAVLERCPLDLKGLGPEHPYWKTYVNLDKEVLKCFVCHASGQGMRLSTVRRKMGRRHPSPNQMVKEMRKGVEELPPLPAGLLTIEQCADRDMMHPACLYLNKRRMPLKVASDAGLLWKDKGIAAWTKALVGSVRKEVGTYSGLVIPIYTRAKLVGWQLCAVPRSENHPKYVTAPSSNLAGALYNFDAVCGSKRLVVVEGVFDALRLPNEAVALLTDNVNDRKRRLISTGGFQEVVLCLDADRSAKHIAKNLAHLQGTAPVVRAVTLEQGDPADYTEAEFAAIIAKKENE